MERINPGEGTKLDQGKPRTDLLPPDVLIGVAAVLEFGARKYKDRNWEKGMSWGRCFGAALRHLFSHWMGEELDPESNLPHIDHALCCIMFLSAYAKRRIGHDDRNKIYMDETAQA